MLLVMRWHDVHSLPNLTIPTAIDIFDLCYQLYQPPIEVRFVAHKLGTKRRRSRIAFQRWLGQLLRDRLKSFDGQLSVMRVQT